MNLSTLPAAASVAKVSHLGHWTLHEHAAVDSTNYVAGRLPAWSAVRADTQSAGRGRFQRSWVSDAGGLWLSAVVPATGNKASWQVMPLVAGLAVIETLKSFGVTNTHLRWPNDIMVGDKKLAGLLLDTFTPNLAVIGLGINVTNQPAAHDAALRATATRLADILNPPPTLGVLTVAILSSLHTTMNELADRGFAALRPRINRLWGGTPRVKVDLDHGQREGVFTGVDDLGRLLLREDSGRETALATHEVKLLREL